MENLNKEQFAAMLDAVCTNIIQNEQMLCTLDSYVGDGDHGVTVARGFTAVQNKLPDLAGSSIACLLETAGDTLAETMGGAIGPIFGSIFSAMGETCTTEVVGAAEMAAMLAEGLDSVMLIGGAQPGDRTLVDALAPAVEAAKVVVAEGGDLSLTLRKAAEGAKAGAQSTKDMVAKKGRAKFLQDKSKGYQDAGATSLELVVEAMADYCAKV